MNTGGLTGWIQGDGFIFLSVGAAAIAIIAWREGSFGRLFKTLVFYAVIASLLKGQQILKLVGWIFRTLFGIELGL
ncbi:hypothetical protein [Streptococcus sanguinis]|uniref:Uncharacterized protein n=1 Tax=Streptococcus sanguinis TaxID=1305 RepID=A0A7H8V359_STRSA|nr:hypothetical protein [Streptococcus sanguinis]QLB50957.1 hypothetical protein FDP16_11060 [Streptococcus sanguinis]